jgi:hypothetical protein
MTYKQLTRLLFLTVPILLFSCMTPQETGSTSNNNNTPSTCKVSFQVETDYQYYYVIYNGGTNNSGKENPKGVKNWEKTVVVPKGQMLSMTTETVTSNMAGSRISAKILVNGKVVAQDEKTTSCPPGSPCNQPMKITLTAAAN